MKVKASAPGKLLLFGDHAVVYGQPCLVAAVDQRMTVTAENSLKTEIVLPKGVKDDRFVRSALNLLAKDKGAGGVRLTTHKGFASKFGFGSSAAVTVATVVAVNQLKNLQLNQEQIFALAYEAILKVQGVGSGFDAAAAVYGGVIEYTKGKKATTIKAPDLPIVVGYTGVKADTASIVKRVAEKVGDILSESGKIVTQAREAIEQEDWPTAGQLMNQNQELLRQIDVTSPELERLISASLQAGAYGAKLSGAGGGDCMIAIVPLQARSKVEEAIVAAGGKIMSVKLGAKGVKIE